MHRQIHTSIPALALMVVMTTPSFAQLQDVVVGVTPHCPYGLEGCFGVANEGLGRLDRVDSVGAYPDTYNCTIKVSIQGASLPDLELWRRQFREVVGDVQSLRGIELTVRGVVEKKEAGLVFSIPKLEQPIMLMPLEHKLQWNFRKKASRGPEPEEATAYEELSKVVANAGRVRMEVTGPLISSDSGLILEVREFYEANEER